MSIRSHLNMFNQIIIDLKVLEVKLDDEDEAIAILFSTTLYGKFQRCVPLSSKEIG